MEIRITKHEGKLKAVPGGYLQGDSFNRYLDACRKAGGRFSKEHKGQLFPTKKLEALAAALTDAGFTATGDADIEAELDRIRKARDESFDRGNVELTARETLLAEDGLAPYPFQHDGARVLMSNRRYLLNDEMGLGKTVQALIALPPDAPTVCIAPAAVKGVWLREVKRWRPDIAPVVLSGRSSFRWPRPGEMVILNWDILPKCTDKKVGRYTRQILPPALASTIPKGVHVIGDEAHAIKNSKALRTKRFGAISRAVRENDGSIWLLTGTPLLNRPPELWQILAAADLARDAFGSWPNFVKMFGGTPGTWGGFQWAPPDEIDPRVPKLLQRVSLMRRRKQVLPELPEKTYSDVTVNGIDAATKAKCDRLIKLLLGEGIDLLGAQDKVDLTALKRVGFTEISEVRSALATAKIPAMLETIEQFEEQDEPVIVFSFHRAPIDTLSKREGWAIITGDVSNERRTEIEDEFQAGKLKGLGLTIGAGGTGLTLTHSAHAVFVDLAWTPALNQQAEDRICRIGQTRGCIITRMHADHALDKRVNELLIAKQELIDATVNAAARGPLTDDDIKPAPPTVDFRRETKDGCDIEPDDEPALAPRSNGYKGKREAANDLERWAAEGIQAVAGLDPDHAATINNVGFSKFDGTFGHSLADQVGRSGKLSEKQWSAAVKLARKYRRQINPEPTAQTALDMEVK